MWRDNGYQSSTSYASINEINVTDQTFDGCLSGNTALAGTGQTAREFLGTTNNWVEMGWFVKYSGVGSGHRWWLFSEWGLDGNSKNQKVYDQSTSPSVPSRCYTANNWDYFEVESEGSGSWSAFVNCEDGVGYRNLINYQVGYTNGVAEGESYARGATTMTGDVHRNMQYEDLHYVLRSSTGMTCRWDTSPYYKGQAVGATEFDVVSGSSLCGP